ncbi:hypothetical protein GJ496_001958 [Pomphorhynchus laevis]|nr:hypothetical protein GJ496_001958 [Pomphorhynchus laevis]
MHTSGIGASRLLIFPKKSPNNQAISSMQACEPTVRDASEISRMGEPSKEAGGQSDRNFIFSFSGEVKQYTLFINRRRKNIDNSGFFTNLLKRELNQIAVEDLGLGLDFLPSPKEFNRLNLIQELKLVQKLAFADDDPFASEDRKIFAF